MFLTSLPVMIVACEQTNHLSVQYCIFTLTCHDTNPDMTFYLFLSLWCFLYFFFMHIYLIADDPVLEHDIHGVHNYKIFMSS
jgi:hypothetical protein